MFFLKVSTSRKSLKLLTKLGLIIKNKFKCNKLKNYIVQIFKNVIRYKSVFFQRIVYLFILMTYYYYFEIARFNFVVLMI